MMHRLTYSVHLWVSETFNQISGERTVVLSLIRFVCPLLCTDNFPSSHLFWKQNISVVGCTFVPSAVSYALVHLEAHRCPPLLPYLFWINVGP